MSVRAIPLLVLAFLLYNAIVLTLGEGALASQIFQIKLLSTGVWTFTWGDFILLVTFVLLFIEIVKSTFTSCIPGSDAPWPAMSTDGREAWNRKPRDFTAEEGRD